MIKSWSAPTYPQKNILKRVGIEEVVGAIRAGGFFRLATEKLALQRTDLSASLVKLLGQSPDAFHGTGMLALPIVVGNRPPLFSCLKIRGVVGGLFRVFEDWGVILHLPTFLCGNSTSPHAILKRCPFRSITAEAATGS